MAQRPKNLGGRPRTSTLTLDDEQRVVAGLIVEARVAKGFSQRSLAERLGVSQSTVSGWESGMYVPSRGRRQQVAKALGLTVDSLRI